MPTYFCTTVEGRLTAEQKGKIAAEITRVHCEVTGAPSFFAQVIFDEVRPGNYFMGGAPLKHDQVFI
jgi:phenylpyruvate tautomerase PptA (4-oxalocrotonate tautomerase family)